MKQGCKTVFTLFGGIIIGFILTIAGIGVGGYLLYQNLTLDKLEQTIGTDLIDLGEFNNRPIKDLVAEATKITNMTIDEIDTKFLDNSLKTSLKLTINDNEIDLTKSIFKDLMQGKIGEATDLLAKLKDNITFGFIYEEILSNAGLDLPKESTLLTKYKNKPIETALSEIGDEKLYTFLNEGQTFDNATLQTVFVSVKNLSINELSDSEKLDNALNTMPINDLLNLTSESSGILKALYEENFTLGDLKNSSSYDDLSINEILELTEQSTGVLGAIERKNWTLKDLKNSENFKTLNVGEILNISNNETGILGNIKTWSLGDLTNEKLNTLTLGNVLNISNNETGFLGAIKDWKLNEISNTKLENLTIKSILNINENETGILGKIKDWKLNEMTNEKFNTLISTMTIGELVEDDILSITNYESKKDIIIGTKTLSQTTLIEFINYAVSTL